MKRFGRCFTSVPWILTQVLSSIFFISIIVIFLISLFYGPSEGIKSCRRISLTSSTSPLPMGVDLFSMFTGASATPIFIANSPRCAIIARLHADRSLSWISIHLAVSSPSLTAPHHMGLPILSFPGAAAHCLVPQAAFHRLDFSKPACPPGYTLSSLVLGPRTQENESVLVPPLGDLVPSGPNLVPSMMLEKLGHALKPPRLRFGPIGARFRCPLLGQITSPL